MIPEDEYLERIVRGINAISNPDAEVQWNANLGGRQFDVMLTFSSGPYKFLVLIEVKGKKRKVSADQLEAFVTKAGDKLANKVVFVSRSGFQSGAINVATKHGVDLFELEFEPGQLEDEADRSFVVMKREPGEKFSFLGLTRSPPSAEQISVGQPTLTNAVIDCRLIYAGGSAQSLPTETTQMQYYAEKSLLSDGRTLREAIREVSTQEYPLGSINKKTVSFVPHLQITPPDEFFFCAGTLASLEVTIEPIMATPLRGNIRFEPTSVAPWVIYRNVASGETLRLHTVTLPLGDNLLEPGRFYFELSPLRYYYCADIEGDLMRIYLVESFQDGQLFQAIISQLKKYSPYYIPVSDKQIIARLSARLKRMREIKGDPAVPTLRAR